MKPVGPKMKGAKSFYWNNLMKTWPFWLKFCWETLLPNVNQQWFFGRKQIIILKVISETSFYPRDIEPQSPLKQNHKGINNKAKSQNSTFFSNFPVASSWMQCCRWATSGSLFSPDSDGSSGKPSVLQKLPYYLWIFTKVLIRWRLLKQICLYPAYIGRYLGIHTCIFFIN